MSRFEHVLDFAPHCRTSEVTSAKKQTMLLTVNSALKKILDEPCHEKTGFLQTCGPFQKNEVFF